MQRIFSLILAVASVVMVSAQSGRRGTTSAPPDMPVQGAKEQELRNAPVARPNAPAEMASLPQTLLDRSFQSIDKGSFRLSDFAGSIIVVNLWATWCGPCRSEVPEYEEVRKEYAGKNVEFIGLTSEDPSTSGGRVKKFVRDNKFGFRVGWADREAAFILMNGSKAIPQTYVITSDGRIISHWRGYSPDHSGERLRETIKRALSGDVAEVDARQK